MAFKLLYTTTSLPQGDFNVDPNLVAEAGLIGNVSGTLTPIVYIANSGMTSPAILGIIDENKTTAFAASVVNETVVSGQTALSHANLVTTSFNSGTSDFVLVSAANGTVSGNVAGAGVSYSYYIPGKAGDDTTLASGKCTIWLSQGEYATDLYEISTDVAVSSYTIGAPLYVSSIAGQEGRLTTTNGGGTHVATVTKAPTAGNPFLHFYWVAN